VHETFEAGGYSNFLHPTVVLLVAVPKREAIIINPRTLYGTS
jgi:hypothetical protein